MLLQILPVNIKGLAGSVATLANWLTAFIITMTATLLLNWSTGGSPFTYQLMPHLYHNFFLLSGLAINITSVIYLLQEHLQFIL